MAQTVISNQLLKMFKSEMLCYFWLCDKDIGNDESGILILSAGKLLIETNYFI